MKMRVQSTLVFLAFFTSILTLPAFSLASTLSCYQVDGKAIFGYDGSEWEYIGAIGNEFNRNSIANEFGAGNEFKSSSIFNEFGKYGSEFRSSSAFNDLASNPPIIVSDDYKFVGYMTTNDFKTPNINTYEAVACAKDSFRSPNSNMEDVTFKRIPGGSSYSGGSGYTAPVTATESCPVNSSNVAGICTCNTGYTADAAKTGCIPAAPKYTCPAGLVVSGDKCVCRDGLTWDGSSCVSYVQNCQAQYGQNATGDGRGCYCDVGYGWSSSRTTCVKTEAQTAQPAQPTVGTDPQLTNDERCIKLNFGTFYNTEKQNCDACPLGTERVAGTNACQTPVPVAVRAVSVPVKTINPQPITNKKATNTQKVEISKAASESTTTIEKRVEDKGQKSAEQGFFPKILGSVTGFFARMFK